MELDNREGGGGVGGLVFYVVVQYDLWFKF